MTKALNVPDHFHRTRECFGFLDDFMAPVVSADLWTPLTADSSSAATLCLVLTGTGAKGGILSITQDATDNDEIYWATTNKLFKFVAEKPIVFETRIQWAELATSANNIMVGLISTAGANTLIDDGGGPVASASMAVIYKVDGGTVWRCRSQIGAAVGQTDTISGSTAGGTAYQTLRIECIPYSSTKVRIDYFLDGVQLLDVNGKPISHDLTYTNAVEMLAFVGSKTGGANAEVLLVDYVAGYQQR